MNIKLEIGRELKQLLDLRKDINYIAQWADRTYANCKEMDDKLERILFSLSALSLGKEFNLSSEELYQIASQLITEGEK